MTMTRQTRKSAITAALFAGGVLAGLAPHWLGPLPPLAMALLFVVTFGLVTWAAFYCWGLMDEAQKEAHKWAWYWGGSTGLLVGFIAVFVALRIDPHIAEAIRPHASSRSYVEFGFAAAAGSTLIGYGLAWTGWWIARR